MVKLAQASKPLYDTTRIACRHCDLVHDRVPMERGRRAHCHQCGSVLLRKSWVDRRYLLPVVLTAQIIFVLANVYPIAELNLQGVQASATLLTVVELLAAHQLLPVALLVFATAFLFPLSELLLMLYLLVPMAFGVRPPGYKIITRQLFLCRIWGMLDVFVIGVLGMLIKLSTMAQVSPGIAFWAYLALMIILIAIVSFDIQDFWEYLDGELL